MDFCAAERARMCRGAATRSEAIRMSPSRSGARIRVGFAHPRHRRSAPRTGSIGLSAWAKKCACPLGRRNALAPSPPVIRFRRRINGYSRIVISRRVAITTTGVTKIFQGSHIALKNSGLYERSAVCAASSALAPGFMRKAKSHGQRLSRMRAKSYLHVFIHHNER